MQLSPEQLADLVAPIALYPDPLLGEILAAATYPTEIVEADQGVRDHPHWQPSNLMDKAKEQGRDPSVQGWSRFRMCSPCREGFHGSAARVL